MTRSTARRLWGLLLLLLAVTCPRATWAADPVAEKLFQEAIALMKESNFTQACPKLAASHAREAKSGTLLVLGSCHEQLGKTATAWAEYTEAATLARTEGREENAAKAEEFANAVAPQLSTLTLTPESPVEGLEVTLDGTPVAAATFGTALPVDPGEHRVDATAPGFVPWSGSIRVGAKADAQSFTIPALTPEAPPPVDPNPEPVPFTPAPAPPPLPAPDTADEGTPTWVWIVGGTGLALIAASIAFRIDQSVAGSALDDNCGADRLSCPATYDFMADRSRETRDFGLFVGLGAGGLVAVGVAAIGLF